MTDVSMHGNLDDKGFAVVEHFAAHSIPVPAEPSSRHRNGALTLAELNCELLTLCGDPKEDERVIALYAKHEGVQYPSLVIPTSSSSDDLNTTVGGRGKRKTRSALLVQNKKEDSVQRRLRALGHTLSSIISYSRSLQDSRTWLSYVLHIPAALAATASAALADTLGLGLEEAKSQASTAALAQLVSSEGAIKAFAWHKYKQMFAVATCDDAVHIYDLNSEAWLPVALEHEFQTNITSMEWRPMSGNSLAIGCVHGVCLWSVVTRNDPAASQYHHDQQSNAANSNRTRVGISASRRSVADTNTPRNTPHADRSLRGGAVSVSPVPLGRAGWMRYLHQPGHTPVTTVAWDPRGTLLASGSPHDNSILLWNVVDDTVTPITRGEGSVGLLRWSPDGQFLLSTSPHSGMFRIWETAHWTCEKWANIESPVVDAAWSPKGDVLVIAERDNSLLHCFEMTNRVAASNSRHHGRSRKPRGGNGTRQHRVAVAPQSTGQGGGGVRATYICTHSIAPYQGEDPVTKQEFIGGGQIKSLAWDPLGERLAISLVTPHRRHPRAVTGERERDMYNDSLVLTEQERDSNRDTGNIGPQAGNTDGNVNGDDDDDDDGFLSSLPEPSELVAIYATRTSPYVELTARGYIRGPPGGGQATQIHFRNHFPRGALLATSWKSGHIGFTPLYFQPDDSFEPTS